MCAEAARHLLNINTYVKYLAPSCRYFCVCWQSFPPHTNTDASIFFQGRGREMWKMTVAPSKGIHGMLAGHASVQGQHSSVRRRNLLESLLFISHSERRASLPEVSLLWIPPTPISVEAQQTNHQNQGNAVDSDVPPPRWHTGQPAQTHPQLKQVWLGQRSSTTICLLEAPGLRSCIAARESFPAKLGGADYKMRQALLAHYSPASCGVYATHVILSGSLSSRYC